MTESTTNDRLLLRIADPMDREAWDEFSSLYQSLIYRVGRRLGLQDADAQDLVQEVLQKVAATILDWESGQPSGSFRRWLQTVARNAAVDSIRRIRPDSARGGTSVGERLQQVSQPAEELDAVFRLEMEREAFRWAARRVQDEFTEPTWLAFWHTMVEGRSCPEVADQLGKSVGAVYISRSRVMQRLKVELQQFDWERIANVDETNTEGNTR